MSVEKQLVHEKHERHKINHKSYKHFITCASGAIHSNVVFKSFVAFVFFVDRCFSEMNRQ
jgi:hypothetical protein